MAVFSDGRNGYFVLNYASTTIKRLLSVFNGWRQYNFVSMDVLYGLVAVKKPLSLELKRERDRDRKILE